MNAAVPAWLQAGMVLRNYGAYTATVNPRAIKYVRRSGDWPGYVKWWPLLACGGDWDLGQEYPPFREEQMRQLFVDAVPYRETDRYRQMLAELEQHGHTRFLPRCHSVEEIDRYFEGVIALQQRIKTEGYRQRSAASAAAGEISIRIGRDGGLIKYGEGTHRLAIARVLQIPKVPVVVDLVHWQWAVACMKKNRQSLGTAIQQELNNLSRGSSSSDVAI
jgi:hypothetical protein